MSEIKTKEYETEDGFVLKEGKKYRWSGTSSGLYNSFRWKNLKCKIKKISKKHITIYDYDDGKNHKYPKKDMLMNNIEFKKLKK